MGDDVADYPSHRDLHTNVVGRGVGSGRAEAAADGVEFGGLEQYEHAEVDRRADDGADVESAEILQGLVRNIGTSNMTIPKLKLLLRDARIKPAAAEFELHPHFQQPELFDFVVAKLTSCLSHMCDYVDSDFLTLFFLCSGGKLKMRRYCFASCSATC